MTTRSFLVLFLIVSTGLHCRADVTNFGTWTPVEDPADPGFAGNVAIDGLSATLSAFDRPIPAGTDIGYQSVNGSRPGDSSQGFYFRPDADFSLAIDYSWNFSNNASGFLGLGFGIGEDGDGENSAGVAVSTLDGSPQGPFAGFARINDANQSPKLLGSPLVNSSTLAGTLFVEYQASTGDVIFGAAPILDANAPTVTDRFDGIQNDWGDDDLMVSFFIRSDDPLLAPAWSGGEAQAVFANFRVLSGNAVAIPEPSMFAACLVAVCAILMCRRRSARPRVSGV